MNDLPALQAQMAQLSNDELLAIVTIQLRGYRPEAVALARAELNRRGFAEADIHPPSTEFIEAQQPDRFPSEFGNAAAVVVAAIVAVFLFPAAFYYSIVVYGLFASVFMAAGYCLWRVLLRTNPDHARGFATGFMPPVVLVLIVVLPEIPWLVVAILVEFLVLCLAIRFIWPE